jgi:6,7-dimethyl-8-ribityllumazine synthase
MNQPLNTTPHLTTLKTSSSPNVSSPTGRIAFIQSGWHKDIVDQCRIGFVAEIERRGVPESRIDFFEVPGAFEIPLQAKLLARTGRYAAVVATGLIVDGGIYRHEFVCDAVINGLMRVQLDTDVPMISAVLTPQHFHEHAEHLKFFREHFVVKGTEAATACAVTIANVEATRKLAA